MADAGSRGPVCVFAGKMCIEVGEKSKLAFISEELCVGCGICVKKCPFDAINIIKIPTNLERETTHRYGPNSFKLHRLPMPRPGQVLGLVGTNGIGKSTALRVLAGKLKPNLGRFEAPPDWQEILANYRGSDLQNYFTKLLEDDIKAIIKVQYVDQIPSAVKGTVEGILDAKHDNGTLEHVIETLDLQPVLDRAVDKLSGGELQRFAIGVVCVQLADVYMLDEPSSYLDVKQRLKAARIIRTLVGEGDNPHYVICVEHDLSVLDYLSDFICVLYGLPGAYGVVTMPFGVRDGINIFLAGYIGPENIRFREVELNFKIAESATDTEGTGSTARAYEYPDMTKKLVAPKKGTSFNLEVCAGSFSDSEIIVLLGENGTGKTTFIRMLAGLLKPDPEQGETWEMPVLNMSYKPQKISPKFPGTVRQLLHKRIRETYVHPQFVSDVIRPMKIEVLMDQEVRNLSGGELQRVAITLSLGMPADIYLIDEPSAYLDSEQRITASKVIRRFIMHAKKTAFVVEHDFIMATYLADRVIVYEGVPSVKAKANSPVTLLSGMNQFLESLEITFRRDPTNYRPRINKDASQLDQEQKASGDYFFVDADDV